MLKVKRTTADFYPRSPCGERLLIILCPISAPCISIHALLAESDNLRVVDGSKSSVISIHALLAESDTLPRRFIGGSNNFYPRSPCGERRQHYGSFRDLTVISIHALLAESDRRMLLQAQAPRNFYPRSPCGERLPPHADCVSRR